MKAYSLDFRQKIVDAYDRGGISQRELAERFSVSVFFVKKLFRQRRLKQTIAPIPRTGNRKKLVTGEIEGFLTGLCEKDNKLTLTQFAAGVEAEFGVRLSNPTVCRAVRRLKLERKIG